LSVASFQQMLTIADSDRAFQYSSRGGGPSLFLLMLFAGAAIALAIAGFYFWNRLRASQGGNADGSVQGLFADLCECHHLSRSDRSLLTGLAQAFELTQPAALFVDPWSLDQAAAAADPDAPRYRAIRDKLFGSAI